MACEHSLTHSLEYCGHFLCFVVFFFYFGFFLLCLYMYSQHGNFVFWRFMINTLKICHTQYGLRNKTNQAYTYSKCINARYMPAIIIFQLYFVG